MTRARLPPRYRWVIATLMFVPAIVATPWGIVRATAADAVRRDDQSFQHADAAVVLGARVYADGRASRFLRERVTVGAHLYLDGVVDALIMSGDGKDSSGYGEPTVMRKVAEDLGVPPDAIIEDPLGVDTYSSCHNARDTFGVSSVIVVSQEFHVPRAVWLCRRVGLEAQGAYPPQRLTKSTLFGHAREVAADAKAMIDVARGREPQG